MQYRLDLAFNLRGRSGVVRVAVEPNTDPEDLGHPLVAIGYDEEAFKGFPCVTAAIHYDGAGPRAWMGWLQVIDRHDTDGTLASGVDTAPFLGDVSPLYTFGYLPTFSDFPANPDHPDGDWVADAFLVAVPDVVRSRALFMVTGFRWGYRLRDGRPVELFTPTALTSPDWEQRREELAEEFPAWEFLPAEAAPG